MSTAGEGPGSAPAPMLRADRARLLELVNAHRSVVSQHELPLLLNMVVEIAGELLDARFAALGVLDTSGTELEQFIHTGMSPEIVSRIGRLPRGGGLLGSVVTEGRAIRSANLSTDPRTCGVPPGHPPLHTFLGVPVRMGDSIYGNLYLADSGHGAFTDDDESVLTGLAATAGIAIANARRLEEARQRHNWLEASAEVTQRLLARDGKNPLALIAQTVADLADADLATLVLPTADPTHLMVEVAVGDGSDDLVAMLIPSADSVCGQVMATGLPQLIADTRINFGLRLYSAVAGHFGAVLALPLMGHAGPRGVLTATRPLGRPAFSPAEVQMATVFANHAAVALELADAQTDHQRVMLLEDRDRIARDLHDHVIQRLFGAGLRLQSLAVEVGGAGLAERLTGQTAELDDIIRQIRTTIFQLRGPLSPVGSNLRRQVLDLVAELRPALGFAPSVGFDGPVDIIFDDDLASEIVATIRETVTNILKHAQASEADIRLVTTQDTALLDVVDNGVGIGDVTRRSGLANLAERAQRLGGGFEVIHRPSGGTHVRMVVPLHFDAASRERPVS